VNELGDGALFALGALAATAVVLAALAALARLWAALRYTRAGWWLWRHADHHLTALRTTRDGR
jgi:hypothetical protein